MVVGTDSQKIIDHAMTALQGKWKESVVPELWDGLASEMIAEMLSNRDMEKTDTL